MEPSIEMIRQRPATRPASIIRGIAEALPFATDSFGAAMAVLTVHHWHDPARGLGEMRRVARGRVVILTFDPGFRDFWLYDYFPDLIALDQAQMPPLDSYAAALGPVEITPVPIPHECTEGFLATNWRRPAACLAPRLRAASSSFRALDAPPPRPRPADARSRRRQLAGRTWRLARRSGA